MWCINRNTSSQHASTLFHDTHAMQASCARCVFSQHALEKESKSYALVLMTGGGSFETLWQKEMSAVTKNQFLAPLYTHCETCKQKSWIARDATPQVALQQFLMDSQLWLAMWEACEMK